MGTRGANWNVFYGTIFPIGPVLSTMLGPDVIYEGMVDFFAFFNTTIFSILSAWSPYHCMPSYAVCFPQTTSQIFRSLVLHINSKQGQVRVDRLTNNVKIWIWKQRRGKVLSLSWSWWHAAAPAPPPGSGFIVKRKQIQKYKNTKIQKYKVGGIVLPPLGRWFYHIKTSEFVEALGQCTSAHSGCWFIEKCKFSKEKSLLHTFKYVKLFWSWGTREWPLESLVFGEYHANHAILYNSTSLKKRNFIVICLMYSVSWLRSDPMWLGGKAVCPVFVFYVFIWTCLVGVTEDWEGASFSLIF